jgi:phage gp29-like protein
MPDFKEYAGIKAGRDWTRGWVTNFQGWLPTTDRLLELKSGGDLKLYEQVAQDDQVKSCLQQRFRALISHDWEVTPAGEKRQDRQVADFVTSQLKALRWDDTVEKMLWGIFYGYSVAEVIWQKQGDKIGIQAIKVRNRRRFHFDEDMLPRLRTVAEPFGEVLPDQKFWHFSCGATDDDEPYGRGLAHWLYWLVFFKKNDIRWWIRFLELYAQPARKGNYPAGATSQEKDVLWNALGAFGVDDKMMIPEGLNIELIEASRSGTADYQALLDQVNSSISKVILSQTMTTDSGSSLSQAQVHQDVGEAVVMADADLLCASFNNSVVKWLCDFNFPGLVEYPRFQYKFESAPDLKALVDRDKVLSDMGFPPTEEYIVSTYGEGFQQDPALAKNSRLNSGQVVALTSLLSQATQSSWSAGTLETALSIAFPQVAPDQAIKLAKSLAAQPALDADPAGSASKAEPTDLNTLFQQAEFGLIPEGTVKAFKGQNYQLISSRWRRVSDGKDLKTGIKIPASQSATTSAQAIHLEKKYTGIANTLEDNGFASPEVEKMRSLADRASRQADRLQDREIATADRAAEIDSIVRENPYTLSRDGDTIRITSKPSSQMESDKIRSEYSGAQLKVTPLAGGGHQVEIGEATKEWFIPEISDTEPNSISTFPASTFIAAKIPALSQNPTQPEIHDFLYRRRNGVMTQAGAPQTAAFERPPDPITELTTTMQAQDHFKPWLQQLQGLLMNSGDLVKFQASLESAFPDLDPTSFREAMIEAATTASLGGYSDSTDSQK